MLYYEHYTRKTKRTWQKLKKGIYTKKRTCGEFFFYVTESKISSFQRCQVEVLCDNSLHILSLLSYHMTHVSKFIDNLQCVCLLHGQPHSRREIANASFGTHCFVMEASANNLYYQWKPKAGFTKPSLGKYLSYVFFLNSSLLLE